MANIAGAALGLDLRPWQDALAAYLNSLGSPESAPS
jgi:hypothetical protein